MGSRRRLLLVSALAVAGVAVIVALLASQSGPASAADDDRWQLVETRVNPDDHPTEFVVGVTPNYYESPRFDGTFVRYTTTGTSLASHTRSVERDFEFWDMTTTVSLTGPPAFLIPGETITLGATGTSTGNVAGEWNPFEQFEFRAEGVGLVGDTFFAIGLNPRYTDPTASVAPSFEVPAPSGPDDEIRIRALLWNSAACLVEWVFQPDLAPPTPTAAPATAAPTATAAATPSTEPFHCFIRGRVRDGGARPYGLPDPDGHPLPDVYVALDFERGTTLVTGHTNDDGEYALAVPGDALPAGFDLDNDEVAVELRLVEAAHDPPRFIIEHELGQAKLWSDRFVLGDECGTDGEVEHDFPLGEIPDDYESANPSDGEPDRYKWEDLGEIYDRFHRATSLADLLGQTLDYVDPDSGEPLRVCAFCSGIYVGGAATGDDQAFWFGNFTSGGGAPIGARISLGNNTSELSDDDWPDNREYHEYGHHFLADAFGDAQPSFEGDINHAGYYVNQSSTDSWTEGFAEFFSIMVSKHIDLEPQPHLYRLQGVSDDFEIDFRPWLAQGRAEELAVASLLLDLEDGPDDYPAGRIPPHLYVDWYEIDTTPALGSVLVGEVVNDAPWEPELLFLDYSEQTMVAAEFIRDGATVHTAWARTDPWDIQGNGSRGFFAMVIPADLSWDRVDVVAFEGRPGDIATDDDLIDLELVDLWEAIVIHKSVQPQSNGYLFDVADLYEAVSNEFGGSDLDGNGMDDIDQLFIAHGLFGDLDGDRSFQDETPGATDHPARGPFPELVPRRGAVVLPGTMMKIDAGGARDAQAVVQITPEGRTPYSYLATPDESGRVHVTVPPRGEVLIGVVAPGYEPAVAGTVDVEQFWADVETRGEDAAPSFAVELVAEKGGGTTLWLIAAAIGGALLIAGGVLWRRRA